MVFGASFAMRLSVNLSRPEFFSDPSYFAVFRRISVNENSSPFRVHTRRKRTAHSQAAFG